MVLHHLALGGSCLFASSEHVLQSAPWALGQAAFIPSSLGYRPPGTLEGLALGPVMATGIKGAFYGSKRGIEEEITIILS